MSSVFPSKASAFVGVVEPAASVRSMLAEVVRELGFTNILPLASGKDVLHVLETEEIHWIIMPLMTNEEVNAVQILKLITLNPHLRKTNVTLLLDPSNETYCLPLAFELGLLSWHRRSYVKDTLLADLEELFALLDMHQGNKALAAAEYIRAYLAESRMHRSRLALEQNLLSLYPGSSHLLVNLAEAEILNGMGDRANHLLSQAVLVNPKMTPHSQRLRDKYQLPQQSSGGSGSSGENILGLKSVVIIDPDTDVLHAAADMLTAAGVKQVEKFEDGQHAQAWLAASHKTDLVIMEWRIPGLSGPALIQRIRQHDQHVPIIVASSLVKKNEAPLLKEMGVDGLLEKPFDHQAFFSAVVWNIQQNRLPTEQRSLETKIRRLLTAEKWEEASRLIAQFIHDDRMSMGAKLEIEAEYQYAKGNYRAACDVGAEALRAGGDSLSLLNLVGKSMLKLKRYETALRCFEKANELSSMNIERLLNMAEANLQLSDANAAATALNQAKAIDAGHEAISEFDCKWQIEAGDVDKAAQLLEGIDSVPKIAAYVNNRAVALAVAGRFEDSIALYKRAMHALMAPKFLALKTTVAYNLGLAYARYGDHEEAKKLLEEICQNQTVPIYTKAKVLLSRIKIFLKNGTPLFQEQLQESPLEEEVNTDGEPPQTAGDRQKMLDELTANLTIGRGEIGCYLIFRVIEDMSVQTKGLIAKMPHFVSRDGIQRKETFSKNRDAG